MYTCSFEHWESLAKNSFMKYSGDIHISFLEPIMTGKDGEQFIKDIENKIYTEIKKFS